MAAILKKLIKPLWQSVHAMTGKHHSFVRAPGLWVLMYHRILPKQDERYAAEEPGMVVQPETFDFHLQQLKKYFTCVKLQDWVDAKEQGKPLPNKACAITFDDGWLDNYEYAWPILKAHQVPATVFAVSEKIGTDFVFWPNAVARVLLSGQTDGLRLVHPFADVFSKLNPSGNFCVPTREGIALWINFLKNYSDAVIYQGLRDINALDCGQNKPSLMNWAQLKAMQSSGWVDVGSHTCNHFRLNTCLDDAVMRHEITASRAQLEAHLQVPVTLFCYPNGDFSAKAQALVQKSYKAAVTTTYGIADATHHLHQLPRIGLHEDASDSLIRLGARLSGRCY